MLNKDIAKRYSKGISLGNLITGENIVYVLVGAILAQAIIFGQLRPLAPAIIAATVIWDKGRGMMALIGALIGLGYLGWSAEYAICGGICIATYFTLYRQTLTDKKQWLVIPATVSALIFVVRSSYMILANSMAYSWVVVVFESFLAGVFTIICIASLSSLDKLLEGRALTLEDKIGCLLLGLGLLLGLNSWYLGAISIQSILSRFGVLLAAMVAGPGGGAAFGTMIGLIPSIIGTVSPTSIGFYALAGLLGGTFQSLGKIGIIIGFVMGNLILSMYFSVQSQITLTVVETAIAAGMFILVPKRYFAKKEAVVAKTPKNELIGKKNTEKMKQMGRIFGELSQAFAPQSKMLGKNEHKSTEFMFKQVRDQVCDKCQRKEICWDIEKESMYKDLVNVCNRIEEQKRFTDHFFSPELQRRCTRLRELGVSLLNQMELVKQEKYYQNKLNLAQDLVARQLEGLGQVVDEFATEISYVPEDNSQLAIQLKNYLINNEVEIKDLTVFQNDEDAREIAIVQNACPNRQWCHQFVAPKISQMLDQTYTVKEACCPSPGSNRCSYHLRPSQTYAITTGIAMATKDGSDSSGDNWACFPIANRKFGIVLSDGMGTGKEASYQSQTTVALLQQLLKGGLSHKLAIDTTNAVLVMRSPNESFATVDLTVVNELGGTIEFVKIGAPPSYIKQRNRVEVIKAKTLPVGILNEVQADTAIYPIQVGDVIVNMTDGVFEALGGNTEEWKKVIMALPQENPQNMANTILELAKQACRKKLKDDFTVIVAKVEYRCQ